MLNNLIPQIGQQPNDRMSQLLQMQMGRHTPTLVGLTNEIFPTPKPQPKNPTPQEVEETINSDLLFRWLYVPFVAAVVFWDRVDTVRDLCKLLDLQDKKKITRELVNLNKEFLSIRNTTFHGDGNQDKAGEQLIEDMENELNEVYRAVYNTLSKKHTELNGDKLCMVAAIHEALVIQSAINKYNTHYQSLLKREYEYTTRNPLPQSFSKARKQMESYFPEYLLPIDGDVMKACVEDILQVLFDIQLFDNTGEIRQDQSFRDYVNQQNK